MAGRNKSKPNQPFGVVDRVPDAPGPRDFILPLLRGGASNDYGSEIAPKLVLPFRVFCEARILRRGLPRPAQAPRRLLRHLLPAFGCGVIREAQIPLSLSRRRCSPVSPLRRQILRSGDLGAVSRKGTSKPPGQPWIRIYRGRGFPFAHQLG